MRSSPLHISLSAVILSVWPWPEPTKITSLSYQAPLRFGGSTGTVPMLPGSACRLCHTEGNNPFRVCYQLFLACLPATSERVFTPNPQSNCGGKLWDLAGLAAPGQLFRDFRYVAARQRFRQTKVEGFQQSVMHDQAWESVGNCRRLRPAATSSTASAVVAVPPPP